MPDSQSAALLASLAPTLMPEIRAYLERHRADLEKLLATRDGAGMTLARQRSKSLDGLLTALFQTTCCVLRSRGQAADVSLAAVGGYGRELVGWASDVDVRLLSSSPERARSFAEAFLYPLWDAGLAVGHQVVAVEDLLELSREDLPTATALLDWRHLAGSPSSTNELLERASRELFSDPELPSFIERLKKEVADRHERFGGSVYLLEPDVKYGAGGLRDLDVALWAARARWRVSGLSDLVRVGALVPREAEILADAAEFLWAARNHLHRRAGRRSDRLTFDMQELLARDLGYAKPDVPEASLGPSVEAFMSDYYRRARAISRLREQILTRAMPVRVSRRVRALDLGSGLRAFEGQVTLDNPDHLADEPTLALRLYAKSVERGERVHAVARDAVARATEDRAFCARLRACPEASRLFVELACTIEETPYPSLLGELHDVGLLLAMIPEFSPVVGRVHHDVYHVYTVDVHSIAAVDRLRALFRDALRDEFPLACKLAREPARPRVALLATLLHDIGKCIGGKDHARRGAEMSREILARLAIEPNEIEDICHLVLQHLVMYHVATRRDLEDPATLSELASGVRGALGLRELYLLTVADLSTTSPTSMTSWKARMLDDLYRATLAMMTGAHENEDHLLRLREETAALGAHSPFLEEFLATMPERYLSSTRPEVIVAHARIVEAGMGEPVHLEPVPSRDRDMAELCVVGRDRPGFLAAVTAALAASRLEVHQAEIHGRALPDGSTQAVDLLWVRHAVDGAEGVRRAIPKLQQDVRSVITGQIEAEQLAAAVRGFSPWRERPTPPIETRVEIDRAISSKHTVIEVMTKDRPGLLFTLAHVLHELGLSIALAKIATEGTRAADVFYVTEADGSKIADGERTKLVRERILSALAESATEGTMR